MFGRITSNKYSDERLGGSSNEQQDTSGVMGKVVPGHEVSYTERLQAQFHTFLTSALDRGKQLTSDPRKRAP